MKLVICIFLLCFSISISAQKKYATISGTVVNENDQVLPKVSVTILGKALGINTNDSGYFTIKVPAGNPFALIFTCIGYNEAQQNFKLSENENEIIAIRLTKKTQTNNSVTVTAQTKTEEISLIKINPKNSFLLPSPTGGIEGLIKVLVGSTNELSSNYTVRGGNYDENLIYVNDFEIFRPYLVSNGQQEGLSFINPQLTQNVAFQLGGFQAKYGDKMSSVLDITYRKPKTFGGSVYISLLEQGFHIEGASKKENFTYLLGIRNRNNQNLLSSQETKGSYQPSSNDVQGLFTFVPNKKVQMEVLANFSQTKFTLIPEFSQKTTSVFSPLFTANLGLDVYFEGQERDVYKTNMLGFATTIKPNKNLKLKFLASTFSDDEKENYDILGAYIFGERDIDKSKATFGQIINSLGVGAFQNYARNTLLINVTNVGHKGSYDVGKHVIQWGIGYDNNKIKDKINEWEMHDSAGYSLPFNPNVLQLKKVLKSTTNFSFDRFSGYVQDNYKVSDSLGITVQAGLRFNYNTLNNQLLLSPRISLAWKPKKWDKNFIFKTAIGSYAQAPFYRELRRPNGSLNFNLKAQQSYHFITGADYNFQRNNKPFKFTAELYYKAMSNVVPYDIENVRLRYFGENKAKAYATGAEFRLFGELVKDAESWVSIGFMKTREDIENDFYYDYKNAAGEIITSKTTDRVVKDSIQQNIGWLRRPSDRLITFGLFFSDYLATNKNLKVYINTITGTNMPYNLPNNPKYRNGLIIEPYLRVDLGFSALLLDAEKMKRRSHAPFKALNNVWLSVEIFNLIDRRNQISFLFIKDYANNTFSIPNRLTPRLLNVKMMARF
jgi:CarboxypepD_reg-like domain/TonB-dependent Receptor Plug Domain